MSVKQRKHRAAKRAHHAKQSKTNRAHYNLSLIGVNAHLDGGKLSTMDRLYAPRPNLSLNMPTFDLDMTELHRHSKMHAIVRALEELDVQHVQPKLRDEVIKAMQAVPERDDFIDFDDLADYSVIQIQLAQLPHQGEIVLVDIATGFPPPSQTIEMIVEKARVAWESNEEKTITPTTDNIVDWLISFGQKICKVKILDYLSLFGTGEPRGLFGDISPELFSRIRAMAGNTTFFPHFPQMQHDVPNPGELILDMEAPVGEGIFKIIKERIGDVEGERFIIDSLGSSLVPAALKDVEVDKPTETPYGSVFFTTPQGKDDA